MLKRLLQILPIALLVVLLVAAFWPLPADQHPPLADSKAGASSRTPSYTGLDRTFPTQPIPETNPTTPEKVELGRLLFFDPVLSSKRTTSCATCHHPDRGFSNGLPTAVSNKGTSLARNVPTLWNVGHNVALFWDGRETVLEDQSMQPITHADEMASDPDQLVSRLSGIDAYTRHFDSAFGSSEVSMERVQHALAAFQRTLITRNSAFDRFAAGQFDALTPQQRRGLTLFRSGATRCNECHVNPTFSSETFRAIGTPSDDVGRAGVADGVPSGTFKVPTLRNVALSGPYMHNGSMASLEEVVRFYADGGGRSLGNEKVDRFVRSFDVSDDEIDDLVAFLHALSDESAMPEIPSAVPSGLPVVRRENVDRTSLAATSTGSLPARRAPQTLTVPVGGSVQATIDSAIPGDTLEIPFGTYHERVVIDLNRITVRGIPDPEGNYPTFDGQGSLSEAFIVSGNDFEISHLRAINFTDNGFLVEGVTNVHMHHLVSENTGIYGIYPVQSTNVLIEHVIASGVIDAAIYAGQSENVVVRYSEVFDSVLGIELENTVRGDIYDNYAHNNSMGIFVVVLPHLVSKRSHGTRIFNNRTNNNNRENDAKPNMAAARVIPGIGIGIIGADSVEMVNNEIQDNNSAGIAVFSLREAGWDPSELDVGDLPEDVVSRDNRFSNNGTAVDPRVADLGVPGADILWDGRGSGNRFDEEGASTFPPNLPTSGWAEPMVRLYSRALGLAAKVLG